MRSPRAARRVSGRFPVGLTVSAAVALSILIGLGVWQLQRLEWKQEVLARRAALEAAPAQPLDRVLAGAADPAALDMVRVGFDCPGLGAAPAERVYSLADGQIVERLVSACPSPDPRYDIILVDRGRVPEGTALPTSAEPGPDTLIGVLRQPERLNALGRMVAGDAKPQAGGLWMRHDLAGIGAALGGVRAAPVYVAAETSSNPGWGELTPGRPSEEIPNRHLEYALTWFSLAVVMVSIYFAMLRRRLKGL